MQENIFAKIPSPNNFLISKFKIGEQLQFYHAAPKPKRCDQMISNSGAADIQYTVVVDMASGGNILKSFKTLLALLLHKTRPSLYLAILGCFLFFFENVTQ